MAHLTSGELFFFGQVAVDAAKQDSHMRKVTLRQARPARRCGQGNAVKLSAKPSRAGACRKKRHAAARPAISDGQKVYQSEKKN